MDSLQQFWNVPTDSGLPWRVGADTKAAMNKGFAGVLGIIFRSASAKFHFDVRRAQTDEIGNEGQIGLVKPVSETVVVKYAEMTVSIAETNRVGL